MASQDYSSAPAGLPEPVDDGACAHLPRYKVPNLELATTDGLSVNLAEQRGTTVVFCYPMTGKPGVRLPDGWDAIPGARGKVRVTVWVKLLEALLDVGNAGQVAPPRPAATGTTMLHLQGLGLGCMEYLLRPQLTNQRPCSACTYHILSLVTIS